MIRISVCYRVHTGWLSPHVKGLSRWGQYVEFTLSLGVPQKERVRKAWEDMFTSNTHEKNWQPWLFCSIWTPAMSARVTKRETVSIHDCFLDFLEKHYYIINTLLVEFKLCWSVQAGRQAGSDGSFRPVCAFYGTIQSSKICRQRQITKRERWLCAGTISYHCVLPEHVICQWLLLRTIFSVPRPCRCS